MRLRRSFPRLGASIALAICLTGCDRTESYRYKLTLAINTPEGVRNGSSVVEAQFFAVSIPARGVMHKLQGEALYVDLGPGRRPLIASLNKQLHPRYDKDAGWSRDGGPNVKLLAGIFEVSFSGDLLEDVSSISKVRGQRHISPNELPDLLTFADIDDPSSVMEIDPNDIAQALGPGVTWNSIALEITDEPVSRGITLKLPWISAYRAKMLDGARYQDKGTLANSLSAAAFSSGQDFKSKKP